MKVEIEETEITLKITATRKQLTDLQRFLERKVDPHERGGWQDWHEAAELHDALLEFLGTT